jgi:hypothetical protein
MAKRKTDFAEALSEMTSSSTAARGRGAAVKETEQAPAKRKKAPAETKMSVYLPHPDVYKAVLELAHAESHGRRKKLNDYLIEGLDLVFAKRNLPSIAELVARAERNKR